MDNINKKAMDLEEKTATFLESARALRQQKQSAKSSKETADTSNGAPTKKRGFFSMFK